MSNYELIKQAIENKKQITAQYQGYYREMCPHVIGTKGGKQQALFFQFGGRSKTQGIVTSSTGKWKCLLIEGLSDVDIQDGSWHTGDGHTRQQTCVDNIDVEVDY